MNKAVAAPTVLALLVGSASLAQDEQERAETALTGVVGITDVITQGNMEDTVTPFETATPTESELTAEEFEDAQLAIQTGDGTDTRAYSATLDSALNRPEVTIDPNALGLADSAIDQSETVLGGMFSADGGTCDAIFQGDSFAGLKMCRAILSRQYESCSETREITLDRQDTWACDVEETIYRKQCETDLTWSCTGETGASCLAQAINISPTPVWNAAGDQAGLNYGPLDDGFCSLKTRTVYVEAADYANLSQLEISQIEFDGVAQVRINGVNVWTYGTTDTGNLTVADRDCGKDCAVPAVYAGSTWIEDCTTTFRTSNPTADIAAYLVQPALGPSSDLNQSPISVTTGAMSNLVRIDILTGNNSETGLNALINVGGSCCSAFTATVGSTC